MVLPWKVLNLRWKSPFNSQCYNYYVMLAVIVICVEDSKVGVVVVVWGPEGYLDCEVTRRGGEI